MRTGVEPGQIETNLPNASGETIRKLQVHALLTTILIDPQRWSGRPDALFQLEAKLGLSKVERRQVLALRQRPEPPRSHALGPASIRWSEGGTKWPRLAT